MKSTSQSNESEQVIALRAALHHHRVDDVDQRRDRVVLLLSQRALQLQTDHRNRRRVERFQALQTRQDHRNGRFLAELRDALADGFSDLQLLDREAALLLQRLQQRRGRQRRVEGFFERLENGGLELSERFGANHRRRARQRIQRLDGDWDALRWEKPWKRPWAPRRDRRRERWRDAWRR